MKKKLLILSASIGLLLACFPFTLCAEEDPESDLGISSPPAYYQLDDYFYDNYQILPYIESSGSQYIDTGIKFDSEYMTFKLLGSNFTLGNDRYILGSFNANNDRFAIGYNKNNTYPDGKIRFFFTNNNGNPREVLFDYYSFFTFEYKNGDFYMNNIPMEVNGNGYFRGNYNLYVFGLNNAGVSQTYNQGSFRLYSFSIYDSDNDEYLRYYYPAKSKSGDVIGLYDAVSKTFVSSATNSVFVNPTGSDASMSITANITNILLNGLGWIGDILSFAISEPLIICFMAIGLAGAMFRWGRRLVHF